MSTSSTGVNVLRYSALVFGVMYGMYHQSSLTARQKVAEIDREYAHKESLIQQAKREYTKRTAPPEKRTESGIITDPEDARFDLEAYLNMKAADTAK